MELNKEWSLLENKSFTNTRFKYCYLSTNAGEVIDKSWWHLGNETLYTCQETPMLSNFDKFPHWKRTKKGDLLLTRNANPYIFEPNKNSIYSNVVQRVRIDDKKCDLRFIKYSLSCAVESQKVNGDTIPSWNMKVWDNLYLPLPSLATQSKIASFLDSKIHSIDSMIETIKSEIDEIKNLKQAYINEAIYSYKNNSLSVARGWVDKIPGGWKVMSLKHVFKLSKGLNITKDNLIDGGYPTISYGQTHNDFYKNEFNPTDQPLKGVDEYYLKFRYAIMRKGDFIFVDTSEDIKGSTDFSMLNNDDFCFAGYHSILAKPTKKIDSRFFMYLFESDKWCDQIRRLVNGVKVYSVTQTIIGNVDVIVPPYDDQVAIAKALDKQLAKFSELIKLKIAKCNELELLKKSMIYEYITGKKEIPNEFNQY